jgi:hypothetical protein
MFECYSPVCIPFNLWTSISSSTKVIYTYNFTPRNKIHFGMVLDAQIFLFTRAHFAVSHTAVTLSRK